MPTMKRLILLLSLLTIASCQTEIERGPPAKTIDICKKENLDKTFEVEGYIELGVRHRCGGGFGGCDFEFRDEPGNWWQLPISIDFTRSATPKANSVIYSELLDSVEDLIIHDRRATKIPPLSKFRFTGKLLYLDSKDVKNSADCILDVFRIEKVSDPIDPKKLPVDQRKRIDLAKELTKEFNETNSREFFARREDKSMLEIKAYKDTVSGLRLFAEENKIIERAKEVGFTTVFYLDNEVNFRQEKIR